MIKTLTCVCLILFCFSCQSFQPDATTKMLHDIWGLKEVEVQGKAVAVKAAQGGVLELFVAEQKFLFSSNGHQYQGQVRYKKDQKITFLKTSPSIPSDAGAIERQFLTLLQSVDSWEIKKLHLHLYSKGGLVARLIKMD